MENTTVQIEYVEHSGRFVKFAKCPKCGKVFASCKELEWKSNVCEKCGQALSW